MKYYTGNGDKGETDVANHRVKKDDCIIELIGTLDELNSFIGYALSKVSYEDVKSVLKTIEKRIYSISAEAAGYSDLVKKENISIEKKDVEEIETATDKFSEEVKALTKFIYLNGNEAACTMNICRAVARRAERQYIRCKLENEKALSYLNRLSSLLFVLFRVINEREGVREETFD
jgi:cob(I)alamin adenosyltransferase